jgi:ABC-2 type transport system permease protein
MSVQSAAPPAAWAEPAAGPSAGRLLLSRIVTFCWLELAKIRHDRTELYTRAIQPVLWLLVFGETFTRIRAIPTGSLPYMDYLAPGIIAQSALFVAIFYGIQIIWERDFGILTRMLATPTPRTALITGKAFGASVRAIAQAIAVFALSAILAVHLDWNPLRLLMALVVIVLGSAFFSTLSMTIAGIVLSRERLMGIGQAITMPLFFASNALYPVQLMPVWLQWLSRVNPLSYEVDALRGLLLGVRFDLALDLGVLLAAAIMGIVAASALLDRLAQ